MGTNVSKGSTTSRPKTARPSNTKTQRDINKSIKGKPSDISMPPTPPALKRPINPQPQPQSYQPQVQPQVNNNYNQPQQPYQQPQQQQIQPQPQVNYNDYKQPQAYQSNPIPQQQQPRTTFVDQQTNGYQPPQRQLPQQQAQRNDNLQALRNNAANKHNIGWGDMTESSRKPVYDVNKWKNLINNLQENLQLKNYAYSRPRRTFKSLNELGVFIKDSPAQTDLEIAWLVYFWISQNIDFDVNGFRTGFYNDLDLEPEGVIDSGKAISWGYARLYEELCKFAGLECISISGYAKGLTYRQNQAFIDPNHEWNAVKLNGIWQYVDVTWGTGYVSDDYIFYRKFIPHYFLTPPNIFIYDHYSEQYQLQAQKMSLRRFEKLPLLKLDYFLDNIQCLSHDILTSIRPIDRNFKMEFTCDEDVMLFASLERVNGEILPNAIVVQIDRVKRIFELLMTLPNGRDSLLNIFTRRNGEEAVFCGEIFIHSPVHMEASIITASESDDSEIEEILVPVEQNGRTRYRRQRRHKKAFDVVEEEDNVITKPIPVEYDFEFLDKGTYELVLPPEYDIAVKEHYDYVVEERGKHPKLLTKEIYD